QRAGLRDVARDRFAVELGAEELRLQRAALTGRAAADGRAIRLLGEPQEAPHLVDLVVVEAHPDSAAKARAGLAQADDVGGRHQRDALDLQLDGHALAEARRLARLDE